MYVQYHGELKVISATLNEVNKKVCQMTRSMLNKVLVAINKKFT